MKAQAARVETDGEDPRRLGEVLGIATAAQALDLVEQFYGPQRLRPVTHLLLEDLFDCPDQPGSPPSSMTWGRFGNP